MATFDRNFPHTGSHVDVDDFIHACSRLKMIHFQLPGNVLFDGLFCPLLIEMHLSPGKVIRVEVTEDQIGIGTCGKFPSEVVASGTGFGPCTLRSHP